MPAISIGLSDTYVQTLLNAFAQQRLQQKTLGAANVAVSSPLIGHLSPQERRVLDLLVAGCSNPEIAQALVVSINTVKTQVRSIYQKLNVKSRREARVVLAARTRSK